MVQWDVGGERESCRDCLVCPAHLVDRYMRREKQKPSSACIPGTLVNCAVPTELTVAVSWDGREKLVTLCGLCVTSVCFWLRHLPAPPCGSGPGHADSKESIPSHEPCGFAKAILLATCHSSACIREFRDLPEKPLRLP